MRLPAPIEGEHRQPLSYDECWEIYTALNADISTRMPASAAESERLLARQPCHIGQPVRIRKASDGTWVGAMRMASGARLVSRVAADPTLGPTPDERLAAQVNAAKSVLAKIASILRVGAFG